MNLKDMSRAIGIQGSSLDVAHPLLTGPAIIVPWEVIAHGMVMELLFNLITDSGSRERDGRQELYAQAWCGPLSHLLHCVSRPRSSSFRGESKLASLIFFKNRRTVSLCLLSAWLIFCISRQLARIDH
jgi:hypothetical protein